MSALQYVLPAVIGYLLGAIPFGYIVARANGINIFEHGSKNPGATNVKRVVGKKAGNLVFALDLLKGMIASGWPLFLYAADVAPTASIIGIVAAILGHSFSVFTRFKGGKGVATAAGGLIMILPIPTVIALVVWVIVFKTSLYVSLASILAAAALPTAAWLLGYPRSFCVVATILAVFVIFRHRANIGRLLKGTENKFSRKPKSE